MPVEKILAFEDFSSRKKGNSPRYNNFYGYWASEKGMLGKYYRKKPHALRFQQEHPDLDKKLLAEIANMPVTSEALKPFDRDLYEAYRIMRGLGVSDRDLFS